MRELLSALRVTPDGGSADVLDNALSSAEALVRSQPSDLRMQLLAHAFTHAQVITQRDEGSLTCSTMHSALVMR